MYKTFADAGNVYLAGKIPYDELQRIAEKFADVYLQELELQRGGK